MRRLLLKLLRRRRLRKDLEDELAFHAEMAAARKNPVPLGNTTLIREQALDLWRFNRIENLWRDISYAARGLLRSPGLLASALLSLGLGTGVNTAMFSIAVEFLFSEPSVKDAESLVYIRLGGSSHRRPEVVEFVRTSGAFADVAGENEETFINWNDGQETHRVFAVQATKNYFTALGIPVAYGRGWTVNDPDEVAVLRHEFWERRLGGDPSVAGRMIRLDGRAYTVLGILPKSHRTLIGYGYSPDIYVPRFLPDTVLAIYARLKPGMTFGEAAAAMRTVALRLDTEMPAPFKYSGSVQLTPVGAYARLSQEPEAMIIALFFAALMTVVSLVLLIACVNVAGLLLARSSTRRQEIAIRLAPGASRGRLLQQLLAESLLLSLLGSAFGFALALSVARLLAAVPLPIPLPIHIHIEPDWRVAGYAALLAIVSTVASGLTPAWQSVRDSLASGLKRERKMRLRRGLVVAQVAFCFIVLATGALFLKNLLRSTAISPGFDINNTLRAEVYLPPSAYATQQRINSYVDTALPRLEAIPGIEAVAAARIIPFTDSTRFGSDLTFIDNGDKCQALYHWNAVSPDYFRAMGIPVLAGRPFLPTDRRGPKIVVVNRAFANRYLGERDPLKAAFQWGENKSPYQIVGVVRETKNLSIGEVDVPQLYEPLDQIESDRPRLQFVLRSATPPAGQLAAVQAALRQVEPNAGLEVATLFSSIGIAFLPSQVGAVLMGSVGVLGLLLAAIGIAGVLAYSVAQRTHEIGVRMALGAKTRDIARTTILEAASLLGIGSALGCAIALFVTRPLAMFLVEGLSPSDPAVYLVVFGTLALTGLIASLGPVLRATSVDPMRCLRHE
jgi:predicted permease